MTNRLFFTLLLILTSFTIFILQMFEKSIENEKGYRIRLDFICDTVHIGFTYTNNNYTSHTLYTMLKSLYFYRNLPLHLHFLVDNRSETIVNTLFDTWNVSQVTVSTYHVRDFHLNELPQVKNTEKFRILYHPEMSQKADKLIVMDPELFIIGDVQLLWNLFIYFNEGKIIGLMKNADNKIDTSVILLHTQKFQNSKLNQTDGYFFKNSLNTIIQEKQEVFFCISEDMQYVRWYNIDEVLKGRDLKKLISMNAIISMVNEDILPKRLFHCSGDNLTDTQIDPVFQCTKYPESHAKMFKRKTLLFVRKFFYSPQTQDVTLVTQLSYEKLPVFEEICSRWFGPISATFYLEEVELQDSIDYINNSTVLKERLNIGYHVVFKRGDFHPVNGLRNVALRNVVTSHVFLADADFIPTLDLHKTLIEYIKNQTTYRTALVVPAFSAYAPNVTIPLTMEDLYKSWDGKIIFPFQHLVFPPGHAPTQYKRLRKSTLPYTVIWRPKYEPYIVVQSNVSQYDERFFAYGHNKISHILTLKAQRFEFVVLPKTFIVHKYHVGSADFKKFLKFKGYIYA